MNTITREDFEAYEAVRTSGVTNMFMLSTVSELSGLDKDVLKTIMKNYETLHAKFPVEMKFEIKVNEFSDVLDEVYKMASKIVSEDQGFGEGEFEIVDNLHHLMNKYRGC